jgi:hypothetical protein
MKATWAIAVILGIVFLAVAGCNRPLAGPANPVSVTVEDRTEFPASLAGRWKADRHGWELVLDPDGRIASAVISLGRVRVVPGQTTILQTRAGEQSVFTPGPWAVDYDPATRILTVKIAMEHVRVPMGPSILEGSSTDVFSGVVSPTMDTWQVQWTTFTEYTAQTAEGKAMDLSTDRTYGEAQPLVFTRTPVP